MEEPVDEAVQEELEARMAAESVNISNVHVNESVGVAFLGTLAVLLLIFLVRSNRRNRELLLEVISLKRQS